MTSNEIEARLRSSLKELTDSTPLANPHNPRADHAHAGESKVSAVQIDPSILQGGADRPQPAREPELVGTDAPISGGMGRRRLLLGATIAVVVIAAFAFAVAYGPRSSDVGGKTEAASWPPVQTARVVPTPKGYNADSTENTVPTGVQTLKDVAESGPENGNTEAMSRAGWRSGVAEYWVESQPAQGQDPSTISLNIDQFASVAEAAAYQAKTVSVANRILSMLYSTSTVRSALRGIPGAVVEKLTVAGHPSGASALIVYHRGPYVVTLESFKTPVSGLVERVAQAQFSRLAHVKTVTDSEEPACSLLTPTLAAASVGSPVSRTSRLPKTVCSYVALPSVKSAEPKGISLQIYYGRSAISAFEGFYLHTAPIVTKPGTPSAVLSFTPVRIDGLAAFWQPAQPLEGGTLSATDKSYVFHIEVSGNARAESVAEEALRGLTNRLG